MRILILACTLFTLSACYHKKPDTTNTSPSLRNINHSDEQLETFLDSVGSLPTQPLATAVAAYADSLFKNPIKADSVISANDFAILKRAAQQGQISIPDAQRIFGNIGIDTTCQSTPPVSNFKTRFINVQCFPFDGVKFNEYAICLGDPEQCEDARLCFMKANRILAVHDGGSHYGLELSHYKDSDRKTVVYYRKEFVRGSGNWWNNLFFYKYDGEQLIPVLNELENGDIANGRMGNRVLWLESSVQKTNPLTIKMVYYDQLPDTTKADFGQLFINDSTSVEYIWNDRLKILEGQYGKSKISKLQILSYYLGNTDLLFINAHYPLFKSSLANTPQRKLTLKYLNVVKNNIAYQK